MDYSELLIKRRAIRDYKDQPVPLNILKEIIKESTLAPSSGNVQPWKFVIVNNKEKMKSISDESKKNLVDRLDENPKEYYWRYADMLRDKDYNVFYNAPALIFITGKRKYKRLTGDCSLCAAYMMNASVVRGLGTCWINFGSDIRDPELLKELGITDEIEIIAPIIIGYPKNIPGATERKEPEILAIIN